MKENKTNSKSLIILIVLLSICVLGLGGYIVYDKVIVKKLSNNNVKENTKTNNNKTNSSLDIDEKTNKVKNSKGKQFYIENGYKLVDIDKINLNKELKELEHYTLGINSLEEDIKKYNTKEDNFSILEHLKEMDINIENEKVYIKYGNNKKYIENIKAKKVVSYIEGCGIGQIAVIILDTNGNIYVSQNNNYDDIKMFYDNISYDKLKQINSNKKYNDFFVVSYTGYSCGELYHIIGESDNKKYYVDTEKEYQKYPYSEILGFTECIINIDRNFYCYDENNELNNKNISLSGKVLLYFNNYFLTNTKELISVSDENNYKIIENGNKVKNVLLNNDNIVFIFENDSEYVYYLYGNKVEGIN